jgi:hypothetical protein
MARRLVIRNVVIIVIANRYVEAQALICEALLPRKKSVGKREFSNEKNNPDNSRFGLDCCLGGPGSFGDRAWRDPQGTPRTGRRERTIP